MSFLWQLIKIKGGQHGRCRRGKTHYTQWNNEKKRRIGCVLQCCVTELTGLLALNPLNKIRTETATAIANLLTKIRTETAAAIANILNKNTYWNCNCNCKPLIWPIIYNWNQNVLKHYCITDARIIFLWGNKSVCDLQLTHAYAEQVYRRVQCYSNVIPILCICVVCMQIFWKLCWSFSEIKVNHNFNL